MPLFYVLRKTTGLHSPFPFNSPLTIRRNPVPEMTRHSIQSDTLQKHRTGGMLVLSPTWNILHINQVACGLLQEFTQDHPLSNQSKTFPAELFKLADEIKDALLIERMAGCCQSIQLTRSWGKGHQKIIVKAFGLTDSQNPLQYRILFLLDSTQKQSQPRE